MSNELQQIYVNAGLSQFFFDKSVPQDLYRGQRHEDAEKGQPIIFPHPGFARKNGPARPPDVQIVERDGKKFVLGCRCVRGLYRGISTFDRTNPALKNFLWYKLLKGTAIPPGLAITQDSNDPSKPNHFTIAPKDDMPLEHFQMLLDELAIKLQKIL